MNNKRTKTHHHPDALIESGIYDIEHRISKGPLYQVETLIFKGMTLPTSLDDDNTLIMIFKSMEKIEGISSIKQIQWSRIKKVTFLNRME